MRILLLGGTTDASALARLLGDKGFDAIYSLAGRTEKPFAQALPMRVGGFGGVDGLVRYLRDEKITHIIDATHPFAAQMSGNAVAARNMAGIKLLALERPGWSETAKDRWTSVPDLASAVAALPESPSRIFLAIGRQHVGAFNARPEHHYLLRLVDPGPVTLTAPHDAIIDRGPFTTTGDIALLQAHQITHIVAKNAGGTGAVAKIEAARALGLPIILIDRPFIPERPKVETPEQLIAALHADLGV
jgi:precorrin-6A/cobalt-precorrin-6A reductase